MTMPKYFSNKGRNGSMQTWHPSRSSAVLLHRFIVKWLILPPPAQIRCTLRQRRSLSCFCGSQQQLASQKEHAIQTSIRKSSFSLAAEMRDSVSATFMVSGFSHNTGFPFSNIFLVHSRCVGWIVPMYTMSICREGRSNHFLPYKGSNSYTASSL